MLWLAVLAVVALALVLAWYWGIFSEPTFESRAREATDDLRERVRELTH